jgi:hypothetical protein
MGGWCNKIVFGGFGLFDKLLKKFLVDFMKGCMLFRDLFGLVKYLFGSMFDLIFNHIKVGFNSPSNWCSFII